MGSPSGSTLANAFRVMQSRCNLVHPTLKVHSCKLYNKKYMIASAQLTTTAIFAFIAVLVLMILSSKVLFINRKVKRNY